MYVYGSVKTCRLRGLNLASDTKTNGTCFVVMDTAAMTTECWLSLVTSTHVQDT